MKIKLNSPLLPNSKKLISYLDKINQSKWLTNFGPIENELTTKLEGYLGVKNLLLVNNGTTALQVAARTLGVSSHITTPFSFVATSSAFLWQGDKISYSDIDKETLNLLPNDDLLAGEGDSIVATHVYGNPCDVDSLENIATSSNKKLIFDAAHAFGVNKNNTSILNFGDASCLSFHATKTFHTVEGGAIIFKNKSYLEKAKLLINFGIDPQSGIKDIGINGKLNEYNAAVGLVNLEIMKDVIEHRSELFLYYRSLLQDVVQLPLWAVDATYNGSYMPIILKNKKQTLLLMNALKDHGVESRRYFNPSLDSIFDNKKICPNSHDIASRILCLPLHYYMSKVDILYICEKIKKELKND